MSEHSRNYAQNNRVFFLGAGFSAAAGIPLTTALMAEAMAKFAAECPGIFSRVDNYARSMLGFRHQDAIDYSNVSMSELCTFLEFIELREYGGGERWRDSGSREKLALKFYLAKTIAQHTPSTNIAQLYLDFASQLHAGDTIVTFNWDGLLEVALEHVGKQYTYNFDSAFEIKICKMHGSVNWRLDEPNDLARPSNTLDWKPMGVTQGMMDTEIFSSDRLLRYDNWARYNPLGEIEPLLVLPGYGKAFDVRSNASLWYKPEFLFALTNDVYIIGLSLAEDDFFIRSFFLWTLPYLESEDSLSKHIYIINPDLNCRKNYGFVLSSCASTLFSENFDIAHVAEMKSRLK